MQLKHVLYVDDEPDIQTIAKFALEEIGGFQVELCSSGMEAIHWLSQHQTNIILMDVMMPAMTGPETIIELKKRHGINLPPIVLITAKIQEREKQSYLSMGCIDVISKPFDPTKISAKLEEIFTRYQDMASRQASRASC